MTDSAAASAQAGPSLRIHVICGGIEDVGQGVPGEGEVPIDAIAVGHYEKVEPQFAELALDNEISRYLPRPRVTVGDDSPAVGVITDFTIRRIIQGELGAPFFLPDPRKDSRLIVVAGMGPVGRFGAPELAVLVEQLFCALARLGRKHLAAVLIGSGTGNLETETAVASWMDGAALAMVNGQVAPSLTDLTFVEFVSAKAEDIRGVLLNYRSGPNRPSLSLSVTPTEPIPVSPEPANAPRPTPAQLSTHISGEKDGKKYLFGALSEEASYHEAHNELDPDTVAQANKELAAKDTPDEQRKAGQALFEIVLPQAMRAAFARRDPFVITCDKHVAQLHWEMMVVPGLPRNAMGDGSEFLGIYPGIARQFRSSFDEPPEAPPDLGGLLRVLIVADTDDLRPLKASAEEASALKSLFENYDEYLRSSGSKRRVSVEALIGPKAANYDSVLQRLLDPRPYDVLHYTGHCEYEEDNPPKSGWLFSGGRKITAFELTQVTHVPEFVFSNACRAGVIPERGGHRAVPSFAESFFQHGVKNFVCTAWAVWDRAACDFACRFYKELLGSAGRRPRHMYEAMREARKSIWNASPSGAQSWGAYQHYGNPWFKL